MGFDYVKHIIEKFPILENKNTDRVASDIYDKNYHQIFENLDDKDSFGDFIDENEAFKSLVYFLDKKKSEEIQSAYENYLKTNQKSTPVSFSSEINNEKIRLKKSEIKASILKSTSALKGGGKPHTKTSIKKENETKSMNGKYAEKLVYEKFKNELERLRWTSESSDIPSERNLSSIYDMEYYKDDQKCFIEVKAATNSFYMSSSEYSFAKANANNYNLYLVDIRNDEIDGPHQIMEFESCKKETEYQFLFESK